MKPRRWPRPGDTAVDRARSIAREYREALWRADPVRCAVLDRAAEQFGESWLTAVAQVTDHELLTLGEVAAALGEKYQTVWQWWHRGRIPREPSGLFRFDAVVAALAAWRADRAGRATDTTGMHVVPAPRDDPDADSQAT